MKVVILAGGGTRMSANGDLAPKPMLDIGGRPILWHIMRSFCLQGFDDFVVAAGSRRIDRTVGSDDHWRVRIVDTGLHTETGERVMRLRDLLGRDPFIVTYGDSVSDVDVQAVVDQHRRRGHLVTVTAVRPSPRFGGIRFDGGFAVLNPAVFDHPALTAKGATLNGLFETLASERRLSTYRHEGFWLAADTLRALKFGEGLRDSGEARWIRPATVHAAAAQGSA